ncbi:hypothetical protein [Niveispirillum cyanobacteriorum]|uniref:hypothetical protein n=1 Tax=Niveispirillum cyanobacteriorum TaxID=1612173 RepID=UPI001319BD0C|nr:hypothetical protein [Niveispirillum cyanobacteriorum]GGE47332.1 hypothetical protein GCM10011317_02130 [Niveispirillum cyanobacteriorum]
MAPPKKTGPSRSAMAFDENGYELVDFSPIALKNSDMIIVKHMECGYIRENKISHQKAQAKSWKICPHCHDEAKERKYIWSVSEILARLSELKLKFKECMGDGIGFVINKNKINKNKIKENTAKFLDEITVVCLNYRSGKECGHERSITIKNLLRKSGGNGCPVCVGNKLPPEELMARAAVRGLTILNINAYNNINSELHFKCANDHEFKKSWSVQRGRGCGECQRPAGEMLLLATCKVLWPDGKWVAEYTIQGADPARPEATNRYDVASEVYKIVIENHSSVHDADKDSHFFKNRSVEETARQDNLKIKAIERGGVLEGWRYAVVRWSDEDIRQVLSRSENNVEALLLDLRDALSKQKLGTAEYPLEMPSRDLPTATEFIEAHSVLRAHTSIAKERGLTFLGDQIWTGFNSPYNYRCDKCGYPNNMWAQRLEACLLPCMSCGDWQIWEGFVYACERAGYRIVNAEKSVNVEDFVELKCLRHNKVENRTRADISRKIRSGQTQKLCKACNDEQPKIIRRRPGDGTTWTNFKEVMQDKGWTVPPQEWRGTSQKDSKIELYEIICKNGHNKKVGIHQALQKANSGSYKCKECDKINRQDNFEKLAAKFGLRLSPNANYLGANVNIDLVCDKLNCPKDGCYAISPSKLKKGPTCNKCKEHAARALAQQPSSRIR